MHFLYEVKIYFHYGCGMCYFNGDREEIVNNFLETIFK